MSFTAVVIVWAAVAIGSCWLGIYVAAQKRRPQEEGFFLGLGLGLLGVLIEALLPTQDEPPVE